MKFMMHLTPAIPATPEERERLAPIAHHTDKIQELLEEMVLSYRPGTRSAWPKILPGLTKGSCARSRPFPSRFRSHIRPCFKL